VRRIRTERERHCENGDENDQPAFHNVLNALG